MGTPTITLSKLVDKLQQHYGSPVPPPSTDPLELIIWENITYLASDKRRAEAFATLKQKIGTDPEQILASQHSALAAIGKAGILPDVSAEKLLAIAKIEYEEFDSDLRSVLKKPLPQAKRALKRFPISCSGSMVKYCASGQSRVAANVRSEIAAPTVGRFDSRFTKGCKAHPGRAPNGILDWLDIVFGCGWFGDCYRL